MRALIRFLVSGSIIFGALLGSMELAHADGGLKSGTYKGIIQMAVHSQASQSVSTLGQTFTDSVTISWIGEGNIDLTITNSENGMAQISYLPVDIFDFAYINFTSPAGSCHASIGIKAKGVFYEIGVGTPNFDPKQKTGKVSFIFGGLESHDILYDTLQGCWTKSMSDAQLIALEKTSSQVNPVVLTVTSFDDDFISGKCSLPDWEGGGSIPNGSFTHTADSCFWWVLKDGEHEWKSK